MLRDVTLGQYYPSNSLLHKMDPRAKILILLSYIVIVFCTFNYWGLLLTSVFVILVVILSKVPIKLYFKSLKMIIFIIIFTSVLNLFYGTGEPIWQWWIFKITIAGINNSVFVAVRITGLILASSALTFTTLPTDLTDAIERLLKPLTIFKVKVHEIALMMTIALRFVPTLLEETDKIMQAQKSRGADMESGNILKRAKALIPVLVPLFISAFRHALSLATAMECRCYHGGKGRTRLKQLHIGKLDIISLTSVTLVIAGVILCNIFLPQTVR